MLKGLLIQYYIGTFGSLHLPVDAVSIPEFRGKSSTLLKNIA